ncbi:hypothetical protein LCGC14_0174930 [marine sediment metagenome]|uniref:Uncharacterized protein n=1 Tax=marine sediment metagenome TaxID=412755 RepID=A0A0F9UV54_9ZZZZ
MAKTKSSDMFGFIGIAMGSMAIAMAVLRALFGESTLFDLSKGAFLDVSDAIIVAVLFFGGIFILAVSVKNKKKNQIAVDTIVIIVIIVVINLLLDVEFDLFNF